MADYRLVPCQRQEGSRDFPDYNLTPHPGTAYIYYKHQIPSTQFQIMGNNRISKAWEIENLARFSRFGKAFPEISPVLSFDLEALDRPLPKGGELLEGSAVKDSTFPLLEKGNCEKIQPEEEKAYPVGRGRDKFMPFFELYGIWNWVSRFAGWGFLFYQGRIF